MRWTLGGLVCNQPEKWVSAIGCLRSAALRSAAGKVGVCDRLLRSASSAIGFGKSGCLRSASLRSASQSAGKVGVCDRLPLRSAAFWKSGCLRSALRQRPILGAGPVLRHTPRRSASARTSMRGRSFRLGELGGQGEFGVLRLLVKVEPIRMPCHGRVVRLRS